MKSLAQIACPFCFEKERLRNFWREDGTYWSRYACPSCGALLELAECDDTPFEDLCTIGYDFARSADPVDFLTWIGQDEADADPVYLWGAREQK